MDGKLSEDISLYDPLDTWTPQAKGSTARVVKAKLSGWENGFVAVKILRPNEIIRHLDVFKTEVEILNRLVDVDGVTQLIEVGFLHLNEIPIIKKINGVTEWVFTPNTLKGKNISF